jgi:hypothetical protein
MFRRITFTALALFLVAWQAMAGAVIDVYILTGQSNSLGTTSNETGDYTPDTHPADSLTSFWWNNVTVDGVTYPPSSYGSSGNAFKNLQMQQGDGGSNPSWWGPEFAFARTLYDAGRTNFVIIKASNSGSGNTQWDKATFQTNQGAAAMWGHLSNTVYSALGKLSAAGQQFNVRGLLYIQGEGNSLQESKIAGQRFSLLYSNLFAAINTSYPGAATNMYAVMGEIGGGQNLGIQLVTTTNQMAAAASNNAIAFVTTHDLPLKIDALHFGKSAKLEIGMRMANCFVGRPTIVGINLTNITNVAGSTAVTFEQYVPDTNGTNDGVNLNAPNPFTGFADGTNGQPRAGMIINGAAGRVVFADFSGANVTSDIQCGQYNFAANGFPPDWTDSGAGVTFTFADPTNQIASALVSAAGFELVSNSKTNNTTVSIYDGRGNALYNSGPMTSGKYGFEAHEAFTEVVTSAVSTVTVQGSNSVRWTIGHVTDAGAPDFAWYGWRLPSSYERWSFQIADATQRGDVIDTDGDGQPNLIEYAMGTNPTNKLSSAKLQGMWTNGTFAIQFPRALADDITWNIERSADLSVPMWELIASKQGNQPWTGSATVNETDSGSGKFVSVTDPASADAAHFVRLRVTRP